MLMYFLCFLTSRDFEIVWFSHEILKLCFAFAFLVVCQVVSSSTAAVHGCFLNSNSIG